LAGNIYKRRRDITINAMGRLVGAIALLVVAISVWAQIPTRINAGDSPRLLTPENSVLVLIDHQPQMAFAAQSMDTQLLVNNVIGAPPTAAIPGSLPGASHPRGACMLRLDTGAHTGREGMRGGAPCQRGGV
jgi:hypothetical protein